MEEDVIEHARNPVALYFFKAKRLGEREPSYIGASLAMKNVYRRELQATYNILYDRIISSDISPWLKQEAEQWFDFNRDFLGFMRTTELNSELESMLTRFNFL